MSLGCVLAVGTFTRFTFVVFFLPLGVALLLQHDALHLRSLDRRAKDGDTHVAAEFSTARLRSTLRVVLHGVVGAVTTTVLFVTIDSWYFGRFTIAPLNNALYNMDTSNLAEHGLHPRWLHSVVNMHVLFGPLTSLTYGIMLYKLYAGVRGTSSRSSSTARRRSSNQTTRTVLHACLVDDASCAIHVDVLCLFCIASGVGFLSLAPHQEARFLLPLLVPVVLVCATFLTQMNATSLQQSANGANGASLQRLYRPVLVLVFIFNALLLLLFGILHQGGLLRSILYLEQFKQTHSHQNQSYNVYFYKTHMPPRFMFNNHGQVGDRNFCNAIDLKGHGIDALKEQLRGAASFRKVEHRRRIVTMVVAPKSVHIDKDSVLSHCLKLHTSFWPHLSMEDLPNSFSELELQMFEQVEECV